MRCITLFLILLFMSSAEVSGDKPIDKARVQLTLDELQLYKLIMNYRKSLKLPSIPLSKSLTFVAKEHCRDLFYNRSDTCYSCDLHSWSNKGPWTVKSDSTDNFYMWNKPQELTHYTSYGYEISAGYWGNEKYVISPEVAMQLWKSSEGHNSVIINKGMWAGSKWNAIGIGMYKGFALVWFGIELDSAGVPNMPK